MGTSQKHLEVIMHLDEDPLMSYQDLADRLGVTWKTAKKRYQELIENDLLYHPMASYDYSKLGMSRFNIIAFCPDYSSLELLELAGNSHPYTSYQTRFIGRKFGLYMVFFIPDKTQAKDHLLLFLEKLQNDLQIISEYNVYRSQGKEIEISQDLSYFNMDTLQWEFDWQDWFDTLTTLPDVDPIPSENKQILKPEEIDRKTLIILNRLTKNAAIKQADLKRDEELDLSQSEIHRYYNRIMETLISRVDNIFNRKKVGLSDLKLYLLHTRNHELLEKFIHQLQSNPPPYRLSLQRLDQGRVLLWTQMDQIGAQTFSLELFRVFNNVEAFDLIIYQNNSRRYYFYVDNFDPTSKSWRTDYSWMIEQPFENLQEKSGSNRMN